MATSIFRLGRLGTLKCLQQDGWGSVRTTLTAAFCTKTETPKKPVKKASTLEAPDDRAALLTHKTIVAFPTRLSTPGSLGQGVVESAPSTSEVSCEAPSKESSTTANTKEAQFLTDDSTKAGTESGDVGAKANATSPTSANVEAQKDDDAASSSSSSSSSSDSDSDSDSDDEKPEKTEISKSSFQTEVKVGQKEIPFAVSEELPSDLKTKAVPEHVKPSVPEGFPNGSPKEAPIASPSKTYLGSPVGTSIKLAVRTAEVEIKPSNEPTSEKVADSHETMTSLEEAVDTTPVSSQSIKLQVEAIPDVQELKSSEVSHAHPKEEIPEMAAESTPIIVLSSSAETASEPKIQPEAALETTEAVAVAATEALVDAAPVITEAEEVQAEPDAAAAQEETPAAPVIEPEPFDNTTYKNLQHHNYNIYTFVDMDVEMAKSRLPQPSTGRPSPRH